MTRHVNANYHAKHCVKCGKIVAKGATTCADGKGCNAPPRPSVFENFDGNPRSYALLRRYNINFTQYEEMYQAQHGRCALCRVKKPSGTRYGLVVDHDHETGTVRGLLCQGCNNAIRLIDNYDVEDVRRYVTQKRWWSKLEKFIPSESQEGVFYRVYMVVIKGRVFFRCSCKAGQTRPHVALPCKHAKSVLLELGVDLQLHSQPLPAPGFNKNGRPIAPTNISALVD